MARIQRVQQRTLQFEPRRGLVLAFQVGAHGFPEGGKIGKAESDSQGVVGLGNLRRSHLLDLDLEFGGFAAQSLHLIVVGEGDLDRRLRARLGAEELRLKAGDEMPGAQHQLSVLGRAALKGLAVDAADKVDDRLGHRPAP